MINYNQVYCFKERRNKNSETRFNGWIDINKCTRCQHYHFKCRDLTKRPGKCFEPGDTLSEYEIELFREFIKGVEGMISTKEVMKFLTKEFNLEIDHSLISKYAKIGIIPQGHKTGHGKAKGVSTDWENPVPYLMYYINQLVKEHRIKLDEIGKYRKLIYDFNQLELTKIYTGITPLNNLERSKFEMIVITYACAEAGHKNAFRLKAINGKLFMPIFYVKVEENRIKELHVKIVDTKQLTHGSTPGGYKAYKEIIYSKEGMKII